jgi:hypothetical protein
MRVDVKKDGPLEASGEITDGKGNPVAHRMVAVSRSTCVGMAGALGVWASLVLDAELTRAQSAPGPPSPEPTPQPLPPSRGAVPREPAPGPEAIGQPCASYPLGEGGVEPVCERGALRADERRNEWGLGAFIMTQSSSMPEAGAAPYAVLYTGDRVFLRPSLLIGDSIFLQASPDAQLYAGRMDGCWRWPGLYARGIGLRLDFCGGVEGGLMRAPTGDSAYGALGPGVDFGAEIGEHLAAVLRGVGGVTVAPIGGSARFEVALSWRPQ